MIRYRFIGTLCGHIATYQNKEVGNKYYLPTFCYPMFVSQLSKAALVLTKVCNWSALHKLCSLAGYKYVLHLFISETFFLTKVFVFV